MNRSDFWLVLSALLLTTVAHGASAAEPPATLCATSAQAEKIREAFSGPKPPAPFAAAAQLKMPEALVVSALPAERVHGVAASNFQSIWKSLAGWDEAVVLIMKSGNVFEVHGKVSTGEPSKRSNFFNLQAPDAGLGGHLRPDLFSAIYLMSMPGGEGMIRGVSFYDRNGEQAFAVFLPGEGSTPSPALVKQFESTAAMIRALPSICAKS